MSAPECGAPSMLWDGPGEPDIAIPTCALTPGSHEDHLAWIDATHVVVWREPGYIGPGSPLPTAGVGTWLPEAEVFVFDGSAEPRASCTITFPETS